MATVKVAVRVRPLNQREIGMDSKVVIEMDGKNTKIFNPKIPMSCHQGDIARNHCKDFSYDYSYWSMDAEDPNFVPQELVFDDLGTKVVDSAFEGYNACVFAYGQTGSGKTYTMMGSKEDVGLIPRICQSLFDRMQQNKDEGVTFRNEVSYLEIYNEKVKDLLKKGMKQHNLRLREHPKLGPYVQDLSKHLVMDYHDVEELMIQGNNARTTASTKMNDTSSRSHAIFTLTFVQAKFDRDMPRETVSKIHLVDLAGSERADTSGATGQRLKEGGHINKSLVTLGSVISALADISTSNQKGRQAFIPYRDSVLTWLLKDSLGGNSKTIMIATISPADCNYGETLSTLRYANRAKNIINRPQVNEDPNVKLIRDLKEEIARLKSKLDNSKNVSSPLMVERLHENEARVKVLTEEWTERWRETQKILQEQKALGLRKAGMGIVLDSDMPHLVGIDDDLLSTGITLYHLKEGQTSIGTEEASKKKQDIVLNGVGIEDEHCIIELQNGTATLIPNGHALCFVDGIQVDKPTKLSQGCVILMGHTNMFRYNDPAEAAKLRRENKGAELNRSRLSFISWSMPDLAHVNDSVHFSASSKQHLAGLLGLPVDGSSLLSRKALQRHLTEAQDVLDGEKRRLKERWDALFEREKHLLKAIDSAGFSEDERKALDKEQESIEAEHECLELEEDRLDEKERTLCSAFQQLEGEDANVSSPPSVNHNQLISMEKDSFRNGSSVAHQSLLEESTESESDKAVYQSRSERPLSSSFDANSVAKELDQHFDLQELKNDERIKDLVEQEVQRQLLNEMTSRLQHIRSLRQQDRPDNSYSSKYYTHPHRLASLGCIGSMMEPFEPCSITIPSFVLRGTGYDTHLEYEVKVVAQDETWTVFRRYKRFRELYFRMKQKYGSQVGNLYFPPRTIFGTNSDKKVKERQAHLERYLQQLLDICLGLPNCPLSRYTHDTLPKEALCDCIPFLKRGLFEIGKHGTA